MQSQVEKEKTRRAEGEESGTPLYLRRATVAGGISCGADSGRNALVRFWRGWGGILFIQARKDRFEGGFGGIENAGKPAAKGGAA